MTEWSFSKASLDEIYDADYSPTKQDVSTAVPDTSNQTPTTTHRPVVGTARESTQNYTGIEMGIVQKLILLANWM